MYKGVLEFEDYPDEIHAYNGLDEPICRVCRTKYEEDGIDCFDSWHSFGNDSMCGCDEVDLVDYLIGDCDYVDEYGKTLIDLLKNRGFNVNEDDITYMSHFASKIFEEILDLQDEDIVKLYKDTSDFMSKIEERKPSKIWKYRGT